MLVFDGKRDGGYDAEERGLLYDGARGVLVVVLETDGKRVIAAVGVIDAERPYLRGLLHLPGIGGTQVQSVVGRCPVAVALVVIIEGRTVDVVFRRGCGKRLSGVVAPCGSQFPCGREMIHAHNGEVVAAVVGGCVPFSAVDALNLILRPRQRVAYPARERSFVLMGTELHAVGPSLAAQYESLYLNLGIEGLAVAIVIHVAYVLVVALGREVVVAARRDVEWSWYSGRKASTSTCR